MFNEITSTKALKTPEYLTLIENDKNLEIEFIELRKEEILLSLEGLTEAIDIYTIDLGLREKEWNDVFEENETEWKRLNDLSIEDIKRARNFFVELNSFKNKLDTIIKENEFVPEPNIGLVLEEEEEEDRGPSLLADLIGY